jgi:hypothetical protein
MIRPPGWQQCSDSTRLFSLRSASLIGITLTRDWLCRSTAHRCRTCLLENNIPSAETGAASCLLLATMVSSRETGSERVRGMSACNAKQIARGLRMCFLDRHLSPPPLVLLVAGVLVAAGRLGLQLVFGERGVHEHAGGQLPADRGGAPAIPEQEPLEDGQP